MDRLENKMLLAGRPAARRFLHLAGRAPSWRTTLAWAGVALGLLLEYGLFRQYALREIVWAYPAVHDQTQYLTVSYDIYEHLLNDGFKSGLNYGLHLPAPTGMLLHVQAAVLFLFLGPGRLSALTLNFFYFALLQVVLVGTVRRLSGRWGIALLAWGLLLGSLSPFAPSGGMMDFRLDFAASCLFGILVCLALRSGLFASRPWSVAVGLATAYMVLFRFLTVVYLGGVVVLFAAFLAVRAWRQRDVVLRQLDRRRLAHLGLAVAVAAVFVLPGLWVHRRTLWAYYVEGHVTGKEPAIRLAMDGHELLFYPRALLMWHLGPLFVKLALLALLAAGVLAAAMDSRRAGSNRWLLGLIAVAAAAALGFLIHTHLDYGSTRLWAVGGTAAAAALGIGLWRRRGENASPFLPGLPALVLLVLLLGVPLVSLTVDLHRSAVVANVVLTPVVWLAILPLLVWCGRGRTAPGGVGAFATTALGIVGIAAGSFFHLSAYASHGRMTVQRADNERLLEFHDTIARLVIDQNIRRPIVSVTAVTDYLPHRISEVLLYERHGVQRPFEPRLGGFLEVSEEDALTCLDASDFIHLSRPGSPVTPFEKATTALLPKLRAYCDEHFVYLGTFRFFGDEVRLYTRSVHIQCKESGWVPGEELTVAVPGRVLRGRSLTLGGGLCVPVPKGLSIRARLVCRGRPLLEVPASLELQGGSYQLRIESKRADIPRDEDVAIHLSFEDDRIPAASGGTPGFVLPPPDRSCLVR
jgi:hypothetical protein